MIEEELLNKIKYFIEDISGKYPIELAYLFGSKANGEENNMSDIDIAIKLKDKYTGLEDALIRGEIMDLGQAIFNIPMDVVSLNMASIFLKYQVVKCGIVLKDSYDRSTFESLVFREYFDFKYYSDSYDDSIVGSIKRKTYFRG